MVASLSLLFYLKGKEDMTSGRRKKWSGKWEDVVGRMTKGGLRFLGEGRREGFYSNFIVLSVLKNKRIR